LASDTPPDARCGVVFDPWRPGATYCLLPAAHNLSLKRKRLQAFYLLWNQSRQGG